MVAIGGYRKFGVFWAQTGFLLAETQHVGSEFFKDREMVNELSDIEFSPDSISLLTGGNDGTVRLWHIGN